LPNVALNWCKRAASGAAHSQDLHESGGESWLGCGARPAIAQIGRRPARTALGRPLRKSEKTGSDGARPAIARARDGAAAQQLPHQPIHAPRDARQASKAHMTERACPSVVCTPVVVVQITLEIPRSRDARASRSLRTFRCPGSSRAACSRRRRCRTGS
jgi:hypothetical protein